METMENSSTPGDVNRRKYFIRERFLLRILGVSLTENESFVYRIYSYFVVSVFVVVYPFIAAGDLFKHEFDVVAELCIYVFGGAMASMITLVVFRHRKRLGKLIIALENEPFIANPERGGDVEDKLISRWYTFNTVQGLVYFVGCVVSIGSKIVYTFILRIRSSDYHDWRFGFGPLTIVNVTYSPNFEITWLYQSTCFMCIACTVSSCIVILVGILAYISVQFKILQNNLKRLMDNSYRLMLKGDSHHLDISTVADPAIIPWKYLKISLKETVLYHLSIIKIVREIEDIFSMMLLSLYLCTLSTLCFEVYRSSLFAITDPRLIAILIEAATVSFQLLLICSWGELIAHESEGVGRAAFQINFVGSDLRFQKALIVMMRRSQDPMRIKAGKLIETSLITFVWVLRAAYSAFMMLRKVNNEYV